jgi:hypothetical protein
MLRRFQANPHCCCAWNPEFPTRVDVMSAGRTTTMRWKISHHGHDPRQIDLLAVLALIVVIIAAWQYFEGGPQPPSTTAFIEPSQSVRW